MPEMFNQRNKSERNGTIGTLSPRVDGIALALASGQAVAEVCRQHKIGRTTLWHWLQQAVFKDRVAELRKQSVDAALGQLAELLGLAAKTYKDLLLAEFTPARLELDTANAVLDRFVGISNFTELRAEIDKLKTQIPEGK
jgi:transposase-like protein